MQSPLCSLFQEHHADGRHSGSLSRFRRSKPRRALAKRLNCSLAIGDKRRVANDDKAELLNIIGDVDGKTAILYDDIVDTGGSLIKMAKALEEHGARRIYAACTHGVLSANAVEDLEASPIEKLFITNTIQLDSCKEECKR